MNNSGNTNIEEDLLNLLMLLKTSELQQMQLQKMFHLRRIAALLRQRNALFHALINPSRRRRLWIRERYGCFWERDVPRNDAQFFKENFRMSRECFDVLCNKLKSFGRIDTNYRPCIPLEKRVAIAIFTLRSSGEYSLIGRLFSVSKASVCLILNEFCTSVWKALAPQYLRSNFLNQDKITECVEGFKKIGFSQCLGAVDGCHIEIRPSANDAVDYYNYKGWHSMVLLALVDYRYRFMYINVGAPGRCNDSQVFEKSVPKQILQRPIMKENAKLISDTNVPVVVLDRLYLGCSTLRP